MTWFWLTSSTVGFDTFLALDPDQLSLRECDFWRGRTSCCWIQLFASFPQMPLQPSAVSSVHEAKRHVLRTGWEWLWGTTSFLFWKQTSSWPTKQHPTFSWEPSSCALQLRLGGFIPLLTCQEKALWSVQFSQDGSFYRRETAAQ